MPDNKAIVEATFKRLKFRKLDQLTSVELSRYRKVLLYRANLGEFKEVDRQTVDRHYTAVCNKLRKLKDE